jgi:hypothetical protein
MLSQIDIFAFKKTFKNHTIRECYKTWEIYSYPLYEYMNFFGGLFTKSEYYK